MFVDPGLSAGEQNSLENISSPGSEWTKRDLNNFVTIMCCQVGCRKSDLTYLCWGPLKGLCSDQQLNLRKPGVNHLLTNDHCATSEIYRCGCGVSVSGHWTLAGKVCVTRNTCLNIAETKKMYNFIVCKSYKRMTLKPGLCQVLVWNKFTKLLFMFWCLY